MATRPMDCSLTEDRSTFRHTAAGCNRKAEPLDGPHRAVRGQRREGSTGRLSQPRRVTYVLLDALALADENKDGVLATDEIAAYVRRHLPALAEKVFKFRQEPQVRLSGAPFALINRASAAALIVSDTIAAARTLV